MPVFTATAAAIATAAGFTAGTTSFLIAQSVLAAGLAVGVGKLTGAFDAPDINFAADFEDPGVNQRLAADPNNRLPILYGNWMTRGMIVFAEASDDRQELYVVLALGEGPVTAISQVYWDQYVLTLDSNGEVTNATDPDGVTTDRLNGNLKVDLHPAGGRSTYLEGKVAEWTATHRMTNIAYAVITLRYNRDDEVTGLNDMRFIGVGSVSNPATAARNLLTNSTYGLGLDITDVDTDSFNSARDYFDEDVTIMTDGVSTTEKRFSVNGALSTGDSISQRIEQVLRGSGSSLRWSNGQYGLFVNRASTAVDYDFDESNIIGSISVAETGFNNLINSLELRYGRDLRNNWQRNVTYLESPDSVKYPNEGTRFRSIDLALTASNTEAERLGTILLNQSRQQLTIRHVADATAMPLEAGDVVRYTDTDYGWENKLFRIVSKVEREVDGALTYEIEAVEYAADVYLTGILNTVDVAPNVTINDGANLDAVNDLAIGSRFVNAIEPYFELLFTTPASGVYEYFDVYLNDTDDFSGAVVHTTLWPRAGEGSTFTNGNANQRNITGVTAGTHYIWVRGRNTFASGPESNGVILVNWQPAERATPETIYRFHENLTTNDPGPPTGPNGTGNDWHVELTNPRWEAVTEAFRTDEEQRQLLFTPSGNVAAPGTKDTEVMQEISFDISGQTGNPETLPAQPSINTFTFAGESAGIAPGQNAQFSIACTGGSSDTENPPDSEIHYLEFSGTTNTVIPASYSFYVTGTSVQSGAADNVLPADLTTSSVGSITLGTDPIANGETVNDFTNSGANTEIQFVGIDFSVRQQIQSDFGNAAFARFDFGNGAIIIFPVEQVDLTGGQGIRFAGVANSTEVQGIGTYSNNTPVEVRGYNTFAHAQANLNSSTFSISISQDSIDTEITIGSSLTKTDLMNDIRDSLNDVTSITNAFTVSSATGNVGDTENVTVVTLTANDNEESKTFTTSVAGSELTLIDTEVSQSGTATTLQITDADDGIDETITYASELTGPALINNTVSQLSALSGITDHYTVGTGTVDGNTVVTLTADDSENKTLISTTVSNGGITVTEGTIQQGDPTETQQTIIRIDYDSDWSVTSQTIELGEAENSDAIATTIDQQLADIDNLTTQLILSDPVLSSGDTLRIQLPDVSFDVVEPGVGTGVHFTNGATIRINGTDYTNNDPGGFATNASLRDEFAGISIPFVSSISADSSDHSIVLSFNNNVTISSLQISFTLTSRSNFGTQRIRLNVFAGTHSVFINDTLAATYESQAASVLNIANNDEFDLARTYNTNLAGFARIIFNYDELAAQTAPTVIVTQDGSTDSVPTFEVSTAQQGLADQGTRTIINVTHEGTDTDIMLDSEVSSSVAASAFKDYVDSELSGFTATVSGSVVTVTSSTDTDETVTASITMGTNEPNSDSSNNLSLGRVQTQMGRAMEELVGRRTIVSAEINGIDTEFQFDNASVETVVDDITTWLAAQSETSMVQQNAGGTGFDWQSSFVGNADTLTITVTQQGLDSDGTDAILTITRTVINDGTEAIVTGAATQAIIRLNGVDVDTETFDGRDDTEAVMTQIRNALNAAIAEYSHVLDSDNSITSTSTFFGSEPDFTIEVIAGQDSDGTPGTFALAKTVEAVGSSGVLDLSDATWTYFPINGANPDTDLLTQDSDGMLSVRRGLILDSTALNATALIHPPSQANSNYVIDSELAITDPTRNIEIVFTGSVSYFAEIVNTTDNIIVNADVEYTIDSGENWILLGSDSNSTIMKPDISLNRNGTSTGEQVYITAPLVGTITLEPNTVWGIRARLTTDANSDRNVGQYVGNPSWTVLFLEELRG